MKLLLIPALASLLALITGMSAEAQPDNSVLTPWEISAGGYLSAVDSDFVVNGNGGLQGTNVNLEDDLGFDTSNTEFYFELNGRPFRRHEFGITYYKITQDADTAITRDISFGNIVFPVTADVKAQFDTQFLELRYAFYALLNERHAVGLQAGAVVFSVDTALNAVVNGRSLVESADGDLVVPIVGIRGKHALIPKLLLDYRAAFITTGGREIAEWSGTVVEYQATLEYRIVPNAGIAIGYAGNTFDLETQKRTFIGSVDYNVGGIILLGRFNF